MSDAFSVQFFFKDEHQLEEAAAAAAAASAADGGDGAALARGVAARLTAAAASCGGGTCKGERGRVGKSLKPREPRSGIWAKSLEPASTPPPTLYSVASSAVFELRRTAKLSPPLLE